MIVSGVRLTDSGEGSGGGADVSQLRQLLRVMKCIKLLRLLRLARLGRYVQRLLEYCSLEVRWSPNRRHRSRATARGGGTGAPHAGLARRLLC